MTVAQAMDLALKLHQGGVRTGSVDALMEARTLYERILEAVPDHAGALHYFGVLLHQTGDTAQGVEMVRKALDAKPDYADAWSNLGNLHNGGGNLAFCDGHVKWFPVREVQKMRDAKYFNWWE